MSDKTEEGTTKLEEHEFEEAWTWVWLHDNGYLSSMPADYRRSLRDFMGRLLNQRLNETAGEPAEPNENPEFRTEPAEPDTLADIHDQSLYLFDKKKLWIPYAADAPSGAKRGTYPDGYPSGAVVHWTAGHRNGLRSGNQLMRDTGMLYLIIDEDGNLAQSDPLNRWGYHAGKSYHKPVGNYVHTDYIGIEVQAAGQLRSSGKNFYPWWDKGRNLAKNRIPKDEVIYCDRRENIAPGWYHKFTPDQMLALRKVLCWLYLNNPDVFRLDRIVGHDEVSPGRKTDPGGALVIEETGKEKALTMGEFRALVKQDVEMIIGD